ncbi:hypothetical protein LMJ41_05115 [Streptomyces globisporus]|nr:hypothetical protein [Streptomyces globisporus]
MPFLDPPGRAAVCRSASAPHAEGDLFEEPAPFAILAGKRRLVEPGDGLAESLYRFGACLVVVVGAQSAVGKTTTLADGGCPTEIRARDVAQTPGQRGRPGWNYAHRRVELSRSQTLALIAHGVLVIEDVEGVVPDA